MDQAYEQAQQDRAAERREAFESFNTAHPELTDPAALFNGILAVHAKVAVVGAALAQQTDRRAA
jgi:hypothetical protein